MLTCDELKDALAEVPQHEPPAPLDQEEMLKFTFWLRDDAEIRTSEGRLPIDGPSLAIGIAVGVQVMKNHDEDDEN